MQVFSIALALCVSSQVGSSTTSVSAPLRPTRAFIMEPSLEFRVSSGAEWDTNAKRAIAGTIPVLGFGDEVVGDGLMRITVDADARIELTKLDFVNLTYLLGAKRFFEQTTEDLLTHDLRLYSNHWLGSWFSLGTWGQAKINRMRSGARDYTFVLGEGNATVHLPGNVSVLARGRATSYDFTDDRLSYVGPGVGGQLAWQATRGLRFAAFADYDWRDYEGPAIVDVLDATTGEPVPSVGLTFCDGKGPEQDPRYTCVAATRADTLLSSGLQVSYRGPLIVGGSFNMRFHRSNSVSENFDRFQVSAFATIPLPWRFVLHLLGTIQLNRGSSLTQLQFQADDDENQNRLDVGLGFKITEPLHIDLKYSLFADEFQNSSVDFLRQTVYLGLTYELLAGAE